MPAQEYIINLAVTAMNNDPEFLRRVVKTMLEMGIVDNSRIGYLLSANPNVSASLEEWIASSRSIAANYGPNHEESLPIEPSSSLILKSSAGALTIPAESRISNPSESSVGGTRVHPRWSPMSSPALLSMDCFSSSSVQEIAVRPSSIVKMTPRKRHCDEHSNSEQLQRQKRQRSHDSFIRGRILQNSTNSSSCMASYGSSTEDNPRFGRFHGFERTVVDRTALRSTRATPLGYANRIARLRPYHHLNNLARMEDSTSITENPTAGIFARGASTRARINAARNRPFDLELTRYRSRGMTATGSDGSVYNFSFVRVFDGKRFLSGLSYYANLGPSRHIHRY